MNESVPLTEQTCGGQPKHEPVTPVTFCEESSRLTHVSRLQLLHTKPFSFLERHEH